MEGPPVKVVSLEGMDKVEHLDRSHRRLNAEGQRVLAGALYVAITEWYKEAKFEDKQKKLKAAANGAEL